MLRFIICFVFLMPTVAFANISLSPFSIELDAGARDRTAQVRFTNTSKQSHTYNIKMVNFKQESDGAYTPLSSPIVGNPFADQYLEFSPHSVTLQPGQSQVVRIQRRSMATAGDAEYVSHLLIQEQDLPITPVANDNSGELAIRLTALYGVSIPVMIENGDLYSTADIENVKLIDAGRGMVARVRVGRGGTRSFYGTLIVTDGKREYGRLEKFRIFMTTPSRVLDIPLSQTPPRDADVVLIDEKTNETLAVWRI